MNFTPSEFVYDRIYETQPLKGVCLFGGDFEPRDYSMVYCNAFFHNLYRLEPDGNGGYQGVLQKEYIEELLNKVASAGRTVVLRPVACEHGAKFDEILLGMLEEQGQMYYNGNRSYPCWDNATLISYFLDFIKQLGENYDGDPRIACVQLGLYGEYGEWNYCGVHPEHHKLVTMSGENQERLVAQYCKYFKKTKLQARNPDLGGTPKYPVGFHDDNFVVSTAEYHTPGWDAMIDAMAACKGAREGEWYELHHLETTFRRAGNLWDRWETQMMGAEISGHLALKNSDGELVFGNMFEGEALNALLYCTSRFHMTFSLGFQRGGGGVPDREREPELYRNFRYAASRFGYDFTLAAASAEDSTLTVDVKNVGIAPFYYDWDVELSLTDENGEQVFVKRQESELSKMLPMRRQQYTFDLSDVQLGAGRYTVRFRIINPLECPDDQRYPLIISNKNRDGEYAVVGTLSL